MKTKPLLDSSHALEATQVRARTVPVYVAYDISDDRRRNRLRRLLRGFGESVQKSVFICWLDSPRRRRLEVLIADFMKAPHPGRESIEWITAHGCTREPLPNEWIFE